MKTTNDRYSLFGAEAIWHLGSPNGNEACPFELYAWNAVHYERLEGEEYAASIARGGDGMAAFFNDSCLSLHTYRARRLRPKNNTVSLYIRACLEKGTSGTLFFSDFLGLSVHQTGLIQAFLGVRLPNGGKTYREIPLAFVNVGGWMDFVLCIGGGKLRFYLNGTLCSILPVPQDLCAPFDDDLVIGGFRCSKPDTYEMGIPRDRMRNTRVDTVALWHRILTEKQIAFLSGVTSITRTVPEDDRTQLCRLKNAFFNASAMADVKECTALSNELYTIAQKDFSRPVYHLTQPFGTIFDPCGAFYYGGYYHVFSYHNIQYLLTYSSLDHYVSKDLVHWTQWPIAPFTDSECDVFCIYLLNHFIDDSGALRTLYTAQGVEGKCGILARSDDGMVTYTDKKPVLTKYHHDGHVFKHDDRWYTITSKLCRDSRPGNQGDPVMMWSSEDLENWVEEGEIFTQRKWKRNPAGFMEFPYLLNFGEKDVLILGGHPVFYWVGHFDWEQKKFLADKEEGTLLDLTNPFHCYNPLCVDDKGENGAPRRLLMALFRDIAVCDPDAVPALWYCTHAQPRVLTLQDDHLRQDPIPELAVRRNSEWSREQVIVSDGETVLADAQGNCVEISARFAPAKTGRCGVRLLVSDKAEETVRVWYDAATDQFGIDGGVRFAGQGPAYNPVGEPVELRIFVDRQLIEVFVNGQSCTTAAITATPSGTGIALLAEGTSALCEKWTIWRMDEAEQPIR